MRGVSLLLLLLLGWREGLRARSRTCDGGLIELLWLRARM